MARCDCCGCEFASDYGTSIVTGEGTNESPYVISQVDADWIRPVVQVRRTTDQTVATGDSFTVISFDTVIFEEGAEFWDISNPTEIVIPEDGVYIFGACGKWAANATGIRELGFRLNGTEIIQINDQAPEATNWATLTPWMNLSYQKPLGAGSILELVARQESGGDLNLLAEADNSITFWAMYVGRFV